MAAEMDVHTLDQTAVSRDDTAHLTRMEIRSNLFEDRTGEYPSFPSKQKSTSASPTASYDSCSFLKRLVQSGDYTGAITAKRELANLSIPIEQDGIYIHIALYAFQRFCKEIRTPRQAHAAVASSSRVKLEDATDLQGDWGEVFLEWWALVGRKVALKELPAVCETLLRHPAANVDLLQRFCLICADGRLSSYVGIHLLPYILRNGNPDKSSAFLAAFEEASEKNPDKAIIDGRVHHWTHWRNVGIITHFNAGRRDLAFGMYKAACKQNHYIEGSTALVILRNVTPQRPAQTIAPPEFAMARYGHISEAVSPSQMATELRTLRSLVLTPPHRAPFEKRLVDFMYMYDCIYKRSRALRIIRNRVFRTGNKSLLDRWITTEMKHYSARKRPIAILRAFEHYFQPGPREGALLDEVRRAMSESERMGKRRQKARDWTGSVDLLPIERKISPSSESISLAWKAVLSLSKGGHDLERLYNVFLSTISVSPVLPALTGSPPSTLASSNTPSPSLALTFHHFVHAFANRISAQSGSLVVEDIHRLGLSPKIGTWAILAGAYAQQGEVGRTEKIITHVERNWSLDRPDCVGGDETDSSKTPEDISPVRRWKIIAFYSTIVRALMDRGLPIEARNTVERMEAKGLLRMGRDKRTRAMVKSLRRMEQGTRGKMGNGVASVSGLEHLDDE